MRMTLVPIHVAINKATLIQKCQGVSWMLEKFSRFISNSAAAANMHQQLSAER